MNVSWIWQQFDQLSARGVYEILALRQNVFVLEQKCLYLDVDGLDIQAQHLLGRDDGGALVAYARLLPPHVKYTEPSIGRVLVDKAARGFGLGRRIVDLCLEKCAADYSDQGVRISAQVYLQDFYHSFGFERVGDLYDDGGIAHVEMVL